MDFDSFLLSRASGKISNLTPAEADGVMFAANDKKSENSQPNALARDRTNPLFSPKIMHKIKITAAAKSRYISFSRSLF